MCEFCSMNDNCVAEKPVQQLKNGEHTFIEQVDKFYQMTSYRKNIDLPYVSFRIHFCPICGRELEETKCSD
ncbi:hypothetical protein [Vagococcus fluvialis]|uniref:hypothetical protein n=1 Tax=Vagococcus fluvialis TaxID=2738 RepID=UPI0028917F06|nr:hypothetical protein [Vagococcus fluvialis]MDT2747044.1 hypothetical protein [Vagococcus fluvialis]